jgi:hypothetical protein
LFAKVEKGLQQEASGYLVHLAATVGCPHPRELKDSIGIAAGETLIQGKYRKRSATS